MNLNPFAPAKKLAEDGQETKVSARISIYSIIYNLILASIFTCLGSVICLLTGHAILRSRHTAGYNWSDRSIAQVGAVGGAIIGPGIFAVGMVLGLILQKFQKPFQLPSFGFMLFTILLQACLSIATGVAAAVIGSVVLNASTNTEYIDIKHAAIAGLVGAGLWNGIVTVGRLLVGGGGFAAIKIANRKQAEP